MTMNQKPHDPFKPLRHFHELVQAKCEELPEDIENWEHMANQHDEESRTYQNIIQSSVEPRQEYLRILTKVNMKISDIFKIIEGDNEVNLPDVNLEMPVETVLRKYADFTLGLSDILESNHSFNRFFNELIDLILHIRSDLSQTILRCSKGDLNFKEVEHHLKVIEPDLETIMEDHILEKKSLLSSFTEQLIQKIELDVSVRQTIQDRHVMHSTLQTYLNQIEVNDDFSSLIPTLQFKIRQIVSRPLDQILSEQQVEVDVTKHELNQLLEPVSGQNEFKVPDSAASVHQLLQQAVKKTEEMNRLKANVIGSFKHLVTQIDQLFKFDPLPPVQAASVLGAAWMQHPLTSADSIRDFKSQLSVIKKSESYIKLTQYMGNSRVDESFRFIDVKMDEMANDLEMNTRLESISADGELPILVNATDVSLQSKKVEPKKARKEILSRVTYLNGVKSYIKQLSDSVRAHLLLVYYEHSLNPEKVNLAAKTQSVLNKISTEFYERRNSDESIQKSVFMGTVKNIFDEMCDEEIEKNHQVFEIRKNINSLFRTLKQTNPLARKTVKKKLMIERKSLKKKLIEVNTPRLKQYIDVLSQGTYEEIHYESFNKIDDLRVRLNHLVQEKLAMEQIQMM
jgi:hypothetical protein